MKSLGYDKVVRMVLVGFVILSSIVLVIINVYLNKEQKFLSQENDINLSQSLLVNNNNIALKVDDVYNQTYLQADWLERIFTNELDIEGTVMDWIEYNPSNDISYIESDALNRNDEFGNIIIKGNVADLDQHVITQINYMNNFFAIENTYSDIYPLEISTIYYSNNGYVAYYPYDNGDVSQSDYTGLFQNVDNLIQQFEGLEEDDKISAIENGWQKTTLVDANQGLLTYSVAMPVVVDGSVDGILVCSISENGIRGLVIEQEPDVDMYLVNQEQEILYSNVEGTQLKGNVYDVFEEAYGNEVTYYKNKFPQAIEKRELDGYTLYISLFERNDWNLIYVYKNSELSGVVPRIIFNALFVLFVVGVVYYGIRNSDRRRNDLEIKARNAKYDSMTNMLNHKNIIDVLEGYYRNKRIKQIGIMMLDIDDFKKVNDTYGHAVGDDVIHICAEVIKEVLEGRMGIGGRYGGEEFLIAIPRGSQEIVYQMAEEIRVNIHKEVLEKLNLDVTVSGGLHYIVKPVELSVLDLINVADSNLYFAKRTGKNRVIKSTFEQPVVELEVTDDEEVDSAREADNGEVESEKREDPEVEG